LAERINSSTGGLALSPFEKVAGGHLGSTES
jgi:hypothetical protein